MHRRQRGLTGYMQTVSLLSAFVGLAARGGLWFRWAELLLLLGSEIHACNTISHIIIYLSKISIYFTVGTIVQKIPYSYETDILEEVCCALNPCTIPYL